MQLNINSTEQQMISNALRLLEQHSTDSIESGNIYNLSLKVEAAKSIDYSKIAMGGTVYFTFSEGKVFANGIEIPPSEWQPRSNTQDLE
jgi:hypothetical protein